MTAATRLRRTQPPVFNPLTAVAWHSAFWASDPAWSNPGDGNAVSTWRNAGSNGTAAVQATGANRPLYRASVSQLNNKPAVEFDGADDLLDAATGTVAQPNTLVVIFRSMNTAQITTDYIVHGGTSQVTIAASSSTALLYQSFTAITTSGTVAVSSPMLAIFTLNGASSEALVNGADVSNGNPGTVGWLQIYIGNRPSLNRGGQYQYGFVGLKASALTTGEKVALLAWSRSFYGTP